VSYDEHTCFLHHDDPHALPAAGLRDNCAYCAPARLSFLTRLLPRQISFHYILSFSNESYGRATSFSRLKDQLGGKPSQQDVPQEYYHPQKLPDPQTRRANATFVVLARNGDLQGVAMSMKQMEDRFNKEFGYPWTFLNDEPFTDEFKR
jgi:alpha 1,2-mannosyltransferase